MRMKQLLRHRYRQFFTHEVIHAMIAVLVMCNVGMNGWRRGLIWSAGDVAAIPAALALLDWLFGRKRMREYDE